VVQPSHGRALAESEKMRGGARREGSTSVMAELATMWLDGGHGSDCDSAGRPFVPAKRERERSSEMQQSKG